MSQISFDGRTAVVTGAGRGLGRAYATELARRGASVVVNDLGGTVDGHASDRAPADQVVDEIRGLGGKAVASYESVATESGAESIIRCAQDAFGPVDVVVANAGILRPAGFARTTEDDLDAHLHVHTKGAFLIARAAWPAMREREYGRFVFISSMAGLFGLAGSAAYGTAKASVVGLSNVLAIEGSRRGIRSNVVAPVAANTRMANAGREIPPDVPERMSEAAVVPMVVYLASDECGHTGAVFSAGGGRYARIVVASSPGWWSEGLASAEDVRDNLATIDDVTSPLLFRTGEDEMRLLTTREVHQ